MDLLIYVWCRTEIALLLPVWCTQIQYCGLCHTDLDLHKG